MTAFIFSLFEFGWVGARTSLLAATLFGGWGALTYLAIGFTLLIGLSDWRPSQRAGIFLLFLAFLLFGDLVWGAERGAINGALYELNHYLLSDFGIIFLGIICLVVGISLLSPSIWYSVGRRLLESGQAIKQEWQERERPERKTAPARKKATPAVPRDAEASSNPPEIEPEPDAVTMHDIPIVGFSEQVVAEKREQKQDASTTDRADEVADMPTEDMMMTAAQDVSDTYELPTFTILSEPVVTDLSGENARLKANATKLVQTLKSFGVGVKVLKIHLGPTVTKYELQPDIGVKVSRITSLSDDLALALAAKDIRIEAPIPGKAAIGIEVPNQEVAPVCLREVLEADTVKREASPLLVALGRSISGETVTVALNKMPHLLVAGSTGSGKSVCINGMIVSILMRTRPDEVRLMMIDPKMVELNVYNGVPHLLTPVVTDPKKAAQALKQVVAEMERRYELFSRYGVRNIEGYNELVDKSEDEDAKRLPFIVVIVDELADLMMVASNDVEDATYAPCTDGPGRRHSYGARDTTAVRRRHHRRHQGEHSVKDRVCRLITDGFTNDSRRRRGREVAWAWRHAHARQRDEQTDSCPRCLCIGPRGRDSRQPRHRPATRPVRRGDDAERRRSDDDRFGRFVVRGSRPVHYDARDGLDVDDSTEVPNRL